MNESQAYQLVVDAMNLATTKGVFNLQDVSNILAALETLRPKEHAVMTEPQSDAPAQ
jgi:hypothetical protein